MTTNPQRERYQCLLAWMSERDISFAAIGEQLGLSSCGARFACQKDSCPTVHHKKLLELGFPPELLPPALDKPRCRTRKIPKFPGLIQQVEA